MRTLVVGHRVGNRVHERTYRARAGKLLTAGALLYDVREIDGRECVPTDEALIPAGTALWMELGNDGKEE